MPSVSAQPAANPLAQILKKLDQILATLGGMKEGNHTLRWDANNSAESRFVRLAAFDNAAVLDKNTGLVWEQAPDAAAKGSWSAAKAYCASTSIGGALGWRLPAVAELASLIDTSLPPPYVPESVFAGVQPEVYWSASIRSETPDWAWVVLFYDAAAGKVSASNWNSDSNNYYAWCVRGPMPGSAY